MSVRLRFQRTGMPKQAHYRLVAIDRRSARNGRQIEILGHYDPKEKANSIVFKMDRVRYWLSCGAQPSDTVRSLLVRAGFFKASAQETISPAKEESAPNSSPAGAS